jgi:hypothetical protein
MKIATATELIAKREQPAARQRRKFFPGGIIIAVGPHEVLALAGHPPRSKRLAADKRSKHLALDPAAAFAC